MGALLLGACGFLRYAPRIRGGRHAVVTPASTVHPPLGHSACPPPCVDIPADRHQARRPRRGTRRSGPSSAEELQAGAGSAPSSHARTTERTRRTVALVSAGRRAGGLVDQLRDDV